MDLFVPLIIVNVHFSRHPVEDKTFEGKNFVFLIYSDPSMLRQKPFTFYFNCLDIISSPASHVDNYHGGKRGKYPSAAHTAANGETML